MTDFQKGMLNLIKSALDGLPAALPENFDWVLAYKTAKKHQILPIFYYGCANSKLSVNYEIYSKIEMAVFKSTALSTKQLYELDVIFKEFEAADIEFMPLKGVLLKPLFPRPEMRQMGDADILIKTEQYDKIRPIMIKLGFEENVESNHEFIWNKPGALFLELHKRLIPSYNKDYYSYFGDGWRLAKPTESSRYYMSDEDNLIYLFTHFAKHYRDGGIGIRHLLDFEVFLKAKPNLDMKYVYAELEKLQLLDFYKNSMKTLDVWLHNSAGDEITELITEKIFGSGSYGTREAHVVSQATKSAAANKSSDNVKRRRIVSLIFPGASGLSQRYPVLKRHKYLLPVFWVVRWFDALFLNRKKIKKQSENLSLITQKNIDSYQNALHAVGLDFNFGE